MIALPPSFAGAVNATDAEAFPRVAVPIVGAPGTVAARTTAFDRAEGGPVFTAFVAVTEHLYVLVFVNEPTTIGLLAPEFEPVAPPLDDVQVAV